MLFRLIDTGFNTPAMNMAIDEALLSSKKPVLRFYGWKPAGLSIGYFQSTQSFNLDNLKKNNIELVRRLTGGNAVLHDKELTYSFIIDESEMPKSVVDSYKVISKGLLQGLLNLGLKAVMNEEVDKGEKSAVCFNDPSWYEIIVNGKKLVGSAQKRVDGKVLQHGAVLIDNDIERYVSLFNCSNDKKPIKKEPLIKNQLNKRDNLLKKLKNRMTSINEELDNKKSYDDVKKAMIKGFEKALDIEFEESELSREEIKLAEKLEKEKYSSKNWNYMR